MAGEDMIHEAFMAGEDTVHEAFVAGEDTVHGAFMAGGCSTGRKKERKDGLTNITLARAHLCHFGRNEGHHGGPGSWEWRALGDLEHCTAPR